MQFTYTVCLINLDEKQYEEAKDKFSMALMFGDTTRSTIKYKELIESGNVEVKAIDCMIMQSEDCLFEVIENKPDRAHVAYYHLAGLLSKTDPERAAEYTIKAAELGHGTSECLLAYGYAHEKASGPSTMAGFVPELPIDYESLGYGAKSADTVLLEVTARSILQNIRAQKITVPMQSLAEVIKLMNRERQHRK